MARKKANKKTIKKAVLSKKASIGVNGKIYYRGDEVNPEEYRNLPKRVKDFFEVTEQEVKEG